MQERIDEPIPRASPADSPHVFKPTDLRAMLDAAIWVPRIWTGFVLFLVVVSCLEIERQPTGSLRVLLDADWPTAVIASLIWLPTLLRLFGLTGGKVRKGDMEAGTDGLVRELSESAIPRLIELRTSTDRITLTDPTRLEEAADLGDQVDRIAELLVADGITSRVVSRLARSYDQLRVDKPEGDDRTVAMTEIVNEARVRASSERPKAAALGLDLVRARSEGERIVGLAFLQEEPDPRGFADVLERITASKSAFEAFHGLNALKNMAPRLSPTQKGQAISALEREKGDPRSVGVMKDKNLPGLIEWTLNVLRD